MQSDGNGFCGYVVLYSFNMAYRDRDSILDQNMKSKYFGIFIMKISNFKSFGRKKKLKEIEHITTRNSTKLGFSATVMLICIFVSCYKELKSS